MGLVSKVAGQPTQEVNRENQHVVDQDDHQPGQVGAQEVAVLAGVVDRQPAEEVGLDDHVVEGDGAAHEKENENDQRFDQEPAEFLGRRVHVAVAPVHVPRVNEVVNGEFFDFPGGAPRPAPALPLVVSG